MYHKCYRDNYLTRNIYFSCSSKIHANAKNAKNNFICKYTSKSLFTV